MKRKISKYQITTVSISISSLNTHTISEMSFTDPSHSAQPTLSWLSCRRNWEKRSWWWRTSFPTRTTVLTGGWVYSVMSPQTPPSPDRWVLWDGGFQLVGSAFVSGWRAWRPTRRPVSCSSWRRSHGWCRSATWWRRRLQRRRAGRVHTHLNTASAAHTTRDSLLLCWTVCRLFWGSTSVLGGVWPPLPPQADGGGGWGDTTRRGWLRNHFWRGGSSGQRGWRGQDSREWRGCERTRGERWRGPPGSPGGGAAQSPGSAGAFAHYDVQAGGEDGQPHRADRGRQQRQTQEQEEEGEEGVTLISCTDSTGFYLFEHVEICTQFNITLLV